MIAPKPSKPTCAAPLIFAAGGNRPRQCGKPAKWLLPDGSVRCNKHRRGRGVPLEVKP